VLRSALGEDAHARESRLLLRKITACASSDSLSNAGNGGSNAVAKKLALLWKAVLTEHVLAVCISLKVEDGREHSQAIDKLLVEAAKFRSLHAMVGQGEMPSGGLTAPNGFRNVGGAVEGGNTSSLTSSATNLSKTSSTEAQLSKAQPQSHHYCAQKPSPLPLPAPEAVFSLAVSRLPPAKAQSLSKALAVYISNLLDVTKHDGSFKVRATPSLLLIYLSPD
jgi:hypothetical protein